MICRHLDPKSQSRTENMFQCQISQREKCRACQNSVFAFSSFTWLLCWSYYPWCMLGYLGAKIAKNTNAGSICFGLCLGCLPAWSFSVFAAAWQLIFIQVNLMLQIELSFAHQTMQPSTVHRTSRREKLEKNGFLANHEHLNLTAKGKSAGKKPNPVADLQTTRMTSTLPKLEIMDEKNTSCLDRGLWCTSDEPLNNFLHPEMNDPQNFSNLFFGLLNWSRVTPDSSQIPSSMTWH